MHGIKAFAILVCILAIHTVAQQSVNSETAAQRLEQWKQSRASLYMNDFGELGRYREANLKLAPPLPGEKRVVFFGDSITDGWELSKYFPGKPYLNRGISAQTTSQMLVRVRQDVINLQPLAVVILAGTNDIAGNSGPISLTDIEANLASIAELARLHHIAVVLSSVTPVNDFTPASKDFFATRPSAEILELNAWIKKFCAENHLVYLDYFEAMVDKLGLMKRELSDDGLHPNPAGYALMAPLASGAIEKALAERK
jgi:lysophospholipase L1-like esterase